MLDTHEFIAGRVFHHVILVSCIDDVSVEREKKNMKSCDNVGDFVKLVFCSAYDLKRQPSNRFFSPEVDKLNASENVVRDESKINPSPERLLKINCK